MKKLLLGLTLLVSISSFASTCLLVVDNINVTERRLAVNGEDFSVQCDGHAVNFTKEFGVETTSVLMKDLLDEFDASEGHIKASYEDSNGKVYKVINTN